MFQSKHFEYLLNWIECLEIEYDHDKEVLLFLLEIKEKTYREIGEPNRQMKVLKKLIELDPWNFKYKLKISRIFDQRKSIYQSNKDLDEKSNNNLILNLARLKIY